eukprot:ctg_631.g340
MSLENKDAGRPDRQSPPAMATDGAPEHLTSPYQPRQTPRVISIQSHVVHGYVGQKACTFPLQLLGFDVDAVNTVQFSNHTAYRHVSGQRATAEHLRELLCGGLVPNQLLHGVQYVLTGYMRSDDWADAVLELLQRIREANAEDVCNQDGAHASKEAPTLRYVCDPVLGDAGRLYVPEEMIAVYRDRLAPHAYLITPNAFELQCLANGESDVERACDWLHRERGPELAGPSRGDPLVDRDGGTEAVVSTSPPIPHAIHWQRRPDGGAAAGVDAQNRLGEQGSANRDVQCISCAAADL